MKAVIKILGKFLIVIYCFFVGMLFWGITAKAYIDPSVVTYLIQALAGVMVAVGAAVGIFWRKISRKLKYLFGIHNEKNIVWESDDIQVYDMPKDKKHENVEGK